YPHAGSWTPMAEDARAQESGSPNGAGPRRLRIAAAGDLHCSESRAEEISDAVASIRGSADLLLLAGDLTTHGEPEEGLMLCEAGGLEVGIAGVKGFVGGFPGSHLPDFGEPLLRAVYRETTLDVEALDRGLREIALCPARIVLMHYSPVEDTIVGEPAGIWAFLGTDRLAAPIAEHEPDLVLHGHAHSGSFSGSIGEVPVYNVSVPVIGRDFWLFELDVGSP